VRYAKAKFIANAAHRITCMHATGVSKKRGLQKRMLGRKKGPRRKEKKRN
jgi:hypothetical protein